MSQPGPERQVTEPDLYEFTATGKSDDMAASLAASVLWALLLEARRLGAELRDSDDAVLAAGGDGTIIHEPDPDALAELRFSAGAWQIGRCRAESSLLELYLPLCAASGSRPVVVAHLGQSLDGCTATASGDSNYVTGPGNLDHLHRMRALADAIVVGAGTIEADDPQLTTRRVPGPSPTRVVIDPSRRLSPACGVFTDGQAPTIVLYADTGSAADGDRPVESVPVPRAGAGLDLRFAVRALAARGLHSLFVEGGGRTVTSFVEANVVDRLQIAIAPLLTGAGRAAVRLPARESIADCLRPASRIFAMGDDVLFDCDLRAAPPGRRTTALPKLMDPIER
jgi:diaminohydroxyphosphoribosylaminopyrimidine deaminase/5-amino-6-(5-phosphoribosylamino)uracil reductase